MQVSRAWFRPSALVALLASMLLPDAGVAQTDRPVNVLLVTAHPDDDAMFAATVYRITHELGGNVDEVVLTDGSGGFQYSELAEPIYGLDLTDERIARQYLPAIRKRELLAAGAIIGMRNFFFLDEFDHGYTQNVDTVLQHVWDADDARERLREIMERGSYDFVFAHLPIVAFHGHHKAATILALEAAGELPTDRRPVVLGSFVGGATDSTPPGAFTEHPGYPVTRLRPGGETYTMDLTTPFGPDDRLNYHIVVNWLIAEHKSQGTMQLFMNSGDLERFWIFDANPDDAADRTAALFARLAPRIP